MSAKKITTTLLLFLLTFTCCNYQKKDTEKTSSKKSITKALGMLPNATVEETIAYYKKLKKEKPNDFNFNDENELNTLGYQYLNNGEIKAAIEIFKLLVSEFPNAFNPYDSLAEAYFEDKDYEKAIQFYTKSLELNPQNSNADRMIFRIKYQTRKLSKFDQVFTKEQYKADMDELAKRIVETHPFPFQFITKKDFYKLVNSQKSKLTSTTTYSQFMWLLSPIIASVGCEHSHFGIFNQEDKMLPTTLRFPLEASLEDSELLVTNSHSNKKIPLGSEIQAINNIEIATIKKAVFTHIASNGYAKSLKKSMFSAYLTSYIPYYFNFPKSYTVKLKGSNKSIELSQLTQFAYTPRNNEYSFDILKPKHTAKLRLPSFSYYGGKALQQYKEFMDNSFATLKNKGINNLIIDLRGNGGGCSCAAIYLLKYISKKTFTYFSPDLAVLPGDASEDKPQELFKNRFLGKVYVLIDGKNTSTSGHFLAMVKKHKMATLIGEESGAGYYSMANVKGFLGTNTNVAYWIARTYYNVTADDFPKNKGILPEHYVYKTKKSILEQKDPQITYALQLIETNK